MSCPDELCRTKRGRPQGLAARGPPKADRLRQRDGVTNRLMQSSDERRSTDTDGNSNNRCR
eukprot:CAMPEP_0183534468 /NCGR_PEP_ID=MMETSP0371-20130417/26904_1 /TAXON_ID=268820 /ORGANISM="Peridinium aciculiferum, Strain PAER-2" /LENGTH=60 /DNA_ID=CAMNT_0025734835 /DNA_START=473 /DNA_END=652 /DNA_ORIENTATION=-